MVLVRLVLVRSENITLSSRLTTTAGFTLIELLLALFIFATIAGVVFGSFATISSGVEKGRQSMDFYRVGRAALQRMAQEVSATIQVPNETRTALEGKDATADNQPRDRITFTVFPYRRYSEQTPGSDLCVVSYYIDETSRDTSRDTVALFREEDCTRNRDEERFEERQEGGLKLELTDLAVGLDITYYDTEESHDQWPPDGGEGTFPLPCMVRLALTLRDAHRHERAFITTVALPMRGSCENTQTN
jgi:general secretion pathway protein J